MTNFKKLVGDITAAPLGDIIAAVGEGVAEAQSALDAQAINQALALLETTEGKSKLLNDLGYRPTFYTIPEAKGEIKVSMTMQSPSNAKKQPSRAAQPQNLPSIAGALKRVNSRAKSTIYATPVDARHQNSFGYTASVSANISFRIVPVPQPPGLESLRVVPDLSGLNFEEARTLLENQDLRAVLVTGDEGGQVLSQLPIVSEIVREGDQIELTTTLQQPNPEDD